MGKSESEICTLFAEKAHRGGWKVYPEVSSWDLLLVWEGHDKKSFLYRDLREGDQLGIEAKTRANFKGLAQCIKRHPDRCRTGPDFIGILAPKITEDFSFVAANLGFSTFSNEHYEGSARKHIFVTDSKRLNPSQKLWVPPVVPDIVPGQPSPSPLTKWRVKALKMCAILRKRGYLTTKDFDRIGISKETWRDRWIERDGRDGRYVKYVGMFGVNDFPDKGWEKERDEIVEASPEGIPDKIRDKILEEGLT